MGQSHLVEAALSRSVIGAFYSVYNALGYGFLERVYSRALQTELITRGHAVDVEVDVPVYYCGKRIGGQRIDMIVDSKLVVEAKSSEFLHPVATRQLLNYLRGTALEIGLVLHFGAKPRFVRVASLNQRKNPNNLPPPRAGIGSSARRVGRNRTNP